MIFRGSETYESRHQRRITKKEVNTIETIAALTRFRWLETTIAFNQEDHPNYDPHPGCTCPWEPHVCPGCSCMEVVSGLNILYADTLDRMKISWSSLRLTRAMGADRL